MIRINLLPAEEKKEIRGLGEFIIGVLVIIAVLTTLVAANFIQTGRIEDVNDRIADTKRQIDDLEQIKDKVEEFKATNKELEEKIKVIGILEENRTGPLFAMDALGKSIPEKAWLDKFSESKYAAKIEGIAWSEITVSDLMKRLQSSPYFQSVELSVIKTKEIQNLSLKTFLITSTLNYSGKIEETQEEAPDGQGNIDRSKSEAKR